MTIYTLYNFSHASPIIKFDPPYCVSVPYHSLYFLKMCINHTIFFSIRVEAVHSRVAELNPYVQVIVSTDVLDESTDLSFLKRYQVGLH